MNIYFIYGCMFAGKSDKMQKLIRRCKQNHVVIKHSRDIRFGIGAIITHDGNMIECFNCTDIDSFTKYFDNKIDAIFIDEIQFFDVEFIKMLFMLDAKIYVSGLDKDFRGEYFETSQYLLDNIPDENKLQLKAECKCGGFATLTKLKSDEKPSSNILVGGAELYEPVCANCN